MTTVQLSNRCIFLHALRMSMLVHSLRSANGLGNVGNEAFVDVMVTEDIVALVDVDALVDADGIVVVGAFVDVDALDVDDVGTIVDAVDAIVGAVIFGANVVAIDLVVDAAIDVCVDAIDMPTAAYITVMASNMLLNVLSEMYPTV